MVAIAIHFIDMQYEAILDSISDGVFTVDLDFNITLFNCAAEQITGFKKEQAIGKKCFEVFRTSICEKNCVLRHTLKTGRPITNKKVNVLRKNGNEMPISISTGILKNNKGKVVGAIETFRDCSEIEMLRSEIDKSYYRGDLVGKGPKMKEIFSLIGSVASSDSTILIEGASGSGKEMVAKAIHLEGKRKDAPFVAINCGAIPFELLESELFGHVKGSFTDAKSDRLGKFDLAKNGTLFLDEISELHPLLQVKLLRVLQEREFTPVGGTITKKVHARILCATNKNLRDLVEQKGFREDLYFRINVFKLKLPPLSERREDIPVLVTHFIKKFNLKTGKELTGVDDEVMKIFMKYPFPGNVRELENAIEHAFILCRKGLISTEHLPCELLQVSGGIKYDCHQGIKSTLDNSEKEIIKNLLQEHNGIKSKVAEKLGIHPVTLWRKLKKFK
ncbi:MAG: sigma 54-interacting transcriptional regulator [Oligoflexia bacterium]|nr:sigma 54-interacting transcriptional regulator [Oligoflexia bacterium]MBF0367059.1 sigma 54-interacting transcriptional regulator [Oligoflexia bacterium]